MGNNKKRSSGNKIFYTSIQEFLGTSIVPKGIALQEQLSKQTILLHKYIEKRNALKLKMKGFGRDRDNNPEYLALKQEYNSIRKGTVELRLEFIHFEYEPIQSKDKLKVVEHINKYYQKHDEKVQKRLKELYDQTIKKYGLSDRFSIEDFELVNSFKKSSKKHRIGY
jgi:hypothetical protein